jgi:hypothetical protein
VQSAMARTVLSNVLTQMGLVPGFTTSDLESTFNDGTALSLSGLKSMSNISVWANNGDILSLCYAHTSALKGDFVRTGKRDFTGMVSESQNIREEDADH